MTKVTLGDLVTDIFAKKASCLGPKERHIAGRMQAFLPALALIARDEGDLDLAGRHGAQVCVCSACTLGAALDRTWSKSLSNEAAASL